MPSFVLSKLSRKLVTQSNNNLCTLKCLHDAVFVPNCNFFPMYFNFIHQLSKYLSKSLLAALRPSEIKILKPLVVYNNLKLWKVSILFTIRLRHSDTLCG